MLKRAHCFFAGFLLLIAATASATTYQVQELQTLSTKDTAQVCSINNLGQMVGALKVDSFTPHAVIWTPEGVVKELGILKGGSGSRATAINDSGQVVGWSNAGSLLWFEGRAVMWDKDGKIKDLGTLGGHDSEACAINNVNQVVGGAQLASGFMHAFIWSADKGMVDMGTLPGDEISCASAINDSRQIVGWSKKNEMVRAVLWESDGRIKELGPIVGLQKLKANDINKNGQIAGTKCIKRLENDGFVWSAKNGFSYTGNLPKLPAESVLTESLDAVCGASATNNVGQAVGTYKGVRTVCRAYIWSATAGMSELPLLSKTDKVTTLGISGPSSEEVDASSSASDINDHGIVVGRSNRKAVVW